MSMNDHSDNRKFEMMFDIDFDLPREDTIRSLDELSRVQRRKLDRSKLLEGAELIGVSVRNFKTGAVQYFYGKNPRRYELMANCDLYGASLIK